MKHYSINFGTPIYCSRFIDKNHVLIGSGGGTSKSGINNKISIIRLIDRNDQNDSSSSSSSSSSSKIRSTEAQSGERTRFEVVHEFLIPKGEDAPMSIDFHRETNQVIAGINSSSIDIQQGKNNHLRSFRLEENYQKLVLKGSQQILDCKNEEDYQRITCISNKSPSLIAIGGTNNQLKILSFPSLRNCFRSDDKFEDFKDEIEEQEQEEEEDKDHSNKENGINGLKSNKQKNQLLSVDFDRTDSKFLIVTTQFIKVYSISRSKDPNQSSSSPTLSSINSSPTKSSSKKKKKKKKNTNTNSPTLNQNNVNGSNPTTNGIVDHNKEDSEGSMIKIRLISKIFPPQSDPDSISSFRTAKFGRGDSKSNDSNTIFTILNQLPRPSSSRNNKNKKKPSILIKYELTPSEKGLTPLTKPVVTTTTKTTTTTTTTKTTKKNSKSKKKSKSSSKVEGDEVDDEEEGEEKEGWTFWKVIRSKVISQKPITSFDLSPDGKFIGSSSSDLSVSILDSNSLRCLISILHAHEFPVTSLKFSDDCKRLVSCSADMSLRVIEIPERIESGWNFSLSIIILICLIGIFISLILKSSSSS